MSAAHLCEVFTSIQGEGLHIGRRQLFVRFSGCNLACRYCDTKESREHQPTVKFENAPLTEIYYTEKNPVPPFRLKEYIDYCYNIDPAIHSVSITGGEPLLQSDFLEFFLLMHKLGRQYHLETNGTLPDALKQVIPLVDLVSMDLKLQYFGDTEFVAKQSAFLAVAVQKPVQIKVVTGRDIGRETFLRAVEMTAAIKNDIPFIIQPETGGGYDMREIYKLQQAASSLLKDVRIIPQIHPFLGIK